MRKSLTLLILLSILFLQDLKTQTVHVTDNGAKYHCRFFMKSKIAIDLYDAKKTYDACKVCHPSQTIMVPKATVKMESQTSLVTATG